MPVPTFLRFVAQQACEDARPWFYLALIPTGAPAGQPPTRHHHHRGRSTLCCRRNAWLQPSAREDRGLLSNANRMSRRTSHGWPTCSACGPNPWNPCRSASSRICIPGRGVSERPHSSGATARRPHARLSLAGPRSPAALGSHPSARGRHEPARLARSPSIAGEPLRRRAELRWWPSGLLRAGAHRTRRQRRAALIRNAASALRTRRHSSTTTPSPPRRRSL